MQELYIVTSTQSHSACIVWGSICAWTLQCVYGIYKLLFAKLLKCGFIILYEYIHLCTIHRSGEEWRVNRSKLGKQLMPANVYGYCPGFNKVSRRFIRNVYDVQNDDGFVEDARDLIRCWSLEGM